MSNAMINRNIFTQVNQDSGSLTSATTVVHKFPDGEAGEYKGLLFNNRGIAVAQFSIGVGSGLTDRTAPPEGHAHEGEKENTTRGSVVGSRKLPAKININLTNLQVPTTTNTDDCGCCDEDDAEEGDDLRVAPGGYAVFYVPAG